MGSEEVLIAVDPHKGHNTLVVLDPVSRLPFEEAQFANTHAGYREMVRFARRWQHRRWAVEGCHGAGRYLAQRLVARGDVVLDVPAKLAARVRVFSQGHGRKTDRDDAVSIGLAALNAAGVQAVAADGAMVSLRLWCDRRDELVASRTQAICRLHRLLVELIPGGSARELSATAATAMLKLVRPKDDVARQRKALAQQHLSDVRSLDRRIKAARDRIAAMVEATETGLVSLYGVGPLVAGRVLAEVGDVSRFPTKDHFATYNGTAPLDVSSGEQVRHRLSRVGNRRVNHVLHIMAVVQVRNPKSGGRAYYERKRSEGKTTKEALRCLKRRLSDVVYRQLVADQYAKMVPCASPTTARPTPSTSTSPTRRLRPGGPPSGPRRPPVSKPSSPSTGRTTVSSVSKSSTPTSSSRLTSSTRLKTFALVDRPTLTVAELSRLADALGPVHAPMMWLGAVGGLRWAECAGLTVGSLDLLGGTVSVSRQLGRDQKLGPPKSVAGRRRLALPRWLVDDIAAHLAGRGLTAADADALVFVNREGRPLNYKVWLPWTWRRACERAGLPTLRFHDVRSMAATALVAAGVDVKTAQTRLGHSSPSVTLAIYARATSEADRRAADAIGEAFRPVRAHSAHDEPRNAGAEVVDLPIFS